MHPLLQKLAIQSWCFRGVRDHASVIASLHACGVSAVELCGFHLDPALESDLASILARYRDAGIAITAYGVETLSPAGGGRGREHLSLTGEQIARRIFAFAEMCPFPTLIADLAPNGIALAESLAAEFHKKVAIHNHGRRHRYGSPWALEELFAHTSPNIGLCLDTAWMIDHGFDPLAIARRFRDRLYALHLKDFTFTPAGEPRDVVMGDGSLPLEALLRYLVDTNWDGSITIEYEGDVQNPVPALTQCVRRFREVMAHITGV